MSRLFGRAGEGAAAVAARLADRVLGLPPGRSGVTVERAVPVPMPDGVTLLGDHYRPEGTTGPAPVVLVRSPYGRGVLSGQVFAAPLARHGFQVFHQSTRGTDGSGGLFRPFTTEREDGLATVAWLREQPWCDGRVATAGASYLGHTQWSVAPYVDPPLVSVSADITAAQMTLAFYHGGAPGLRNALSWSATIGRQERSTPLSAPLTGLRLRRALRRLPLQAADLDVAGAPVAFWRDFTGHAEPGDTFWAGADHDRADLSRMPPTSMVTGWWDLFVAGQVDDFARLRRAGVPSRLTVGPWRHGEPGEIGAIVRDNVAWLREHLLDQPGEDRPPVRLWIQNAEVWRDFEDWPPPATPRSFLLGAGGGLGPDPSTGSDTFVHDPARPTPTVGGPMLAPPAKQADNGDVEARHDVLVYTSAPLPADLDVAGPVTARVFVRTSLEHADLFVRVCDVEDRPDGRQVSLNVVDGIRRLRPDTVPAPDVSVGDDGVLAVDLRLFPTGYRFAAGHRVRVQVAGGAFPRFARNLGTGEGFATGIRGVTCRIDVLHDDAHPSSVTLPVLDREGRTSAT